MDISYTERIVAFIDVLGFKDIVAESERNIEKLQLIFETLTFLKEDKKMGSSLRLTLVVN